MGPGSTVAGYRLEQVIGRGGMGIVYTAHDERLDRRVALKLIAPELAADTVLRRRFLDESRIAAGIEHPHVIPVYEAGEADGALYLAMQLVDGDDLRSTLLQRGALSDDRAIPIIVQVASALEAAHARGLVHRDVKPSNILLAPVAGGDHAYLSDFGLCKPVEATRGVTASGQVVGTVDYMAPEQLRGAHADGRADIYALGCVTFQCLTGAPPYTGSDVAVMLAHLQQPTPRLPGNPAVDEVLQRALAKAPEDRWPTVGEFASTLREASSSHTRPTATRASAALPPAPPPRRSRRRLAAAAAVVACLLAVVVAAVLVRQSSGPSGGHAPLRIQSESALGSRRTVLAGGRGGLYVIRRSTAGGVVNQVDTNSGELMPGVTLDSIPVGVGVSGFGAWVLSVDSTHAGRATLLRVEGGSATPAQQLKGQPGCVDFVQLICNPVVGGGSIWVPVGSRHLPRRRQRQRHPEALPARRCGGAGDLRPRGAVGAEWPLAGTDRRIVRAAHGTAAGRPGCRAPPRPADRGRVAAVDRLLRQRAIG